MTETPDRPYDEGFYLCRDTGRLVEEGQCPVHLGDACVILFIPHDRLDKADQ